MKTVSVALPIEAAERILREAAKDAAYYGALVDHVTRAAGNRPGSLKGKTFDDARAEWRRDYLEAKRLVEAFGVEVEQTSEAETIGVGYGTKPKLGPNGRPRKLVLGMFREVETDFDKRHPEYRREVHAEACRQAAARVVRAWRSLLEGRVAA
jgi:hypothetical protein